MLEFALAFSILFPIFAGCFHFGYSFFVYNQLETAVRSAARYASQRAYDSKNETPSSAYANAVKNLAVYGDPAGGQTPQLAGLGLENIVLNVTFEASVPRWVTVSVTNLTVDTVFADISFDTKPRVRVPFVGRFAPPT
jgi:Flp pilus assembly protein TadG